MFLTRPSVSPIGGNDKACRELLSRHISIGQCSERGCRGRKRLTFFVYALQNPNPTTALPAASAQLNLINNMDIEFGNLKAAFTRARIASDEKEQEKILEAMRRNLIERNGGNFVVIDTLTKGSPISIDTANLEDLYRADGILAARKTSKDPDRMV